MATKRTDYFFDTLSDKGDSRGTKSGARELAYVEPAKSFEKIFIID